MNMTKDDTELVLGSKMIYRRWSADKYGRLWGAYGGMWKPGVNTAKCSNNHDREAYNERVRKQREQDSQDRRDEMKYTGSPISSRRTYGSFLSLKDCNCGYYGFYKPGNAEYRNGLPIIGVAELTGEVVEGDRGVRGQRAEIKALVIYKPSFLRKKHIDLARWFSTRASFAIFTSIALFLLTCGLGALIITGLIDGNIASLGLLLPLAPTVFVFTAAFISDGELPEWDHTGERIANVYPGVEIFPTERAMLKKYPEVEPPTPDPTSDEFWDLPA